MVKQARQSEDFSNSLVGGPVEELRFLVTMNFSSFRCVSIPRECNRVAHELAAIGGVIVTKEVRQSSIHFRRTFM